MTLLPELQRVVDTLGALGSLGISGQLIWHLLWCGDEF
jgi:hypothetical protein